MTLAPHKTKLVSAIGPAFVLLFSLTMSSGCSHFAAARKTVSRINPFAGSMAGGKAALTVHDLQLELMRFADEYSGVAAEVADLLTAEAKTSADRVRPLAMKTAQANAAISIASGSNPLGGIMDMAVLATLTRSSFEDYLVPRVYGEDARWVVARYGEVEGKAWDLVAQILDSKQQDELKESIDQWRANNPDQHYVSFVRLQNMYKPEAAGEDKVKTPGSVFSLLFVDPFAGLDPAAREIELSRHMAERALYQFQRMPRLLDWQLSLVLAKSLATKETQNLLGAVERFSTAAEALPGQIAKERVAIVKDLDAYEPKLQVLLAEFRETFEAGGNAANSVNETVLALDSFVSGLARTSVPGATSTPAAKPFDVTEYGSSAAQIASAVREMNTLVNSLSQWEGAIARAEAAGMELVDHVFWRAVAFALILIAGAVAAILFCRAVATRSRNRSMESA